MIKHEICIKNPHLAHSMPTKNVPIDEGLLLACQTEKPPWLSTTAFVNEMVSQGLKGVAEHVTLKVPSGTETHKKERKKENKSDGTLSNINRVSNSINKEKEIFKKTRFKFSKELIPFELQSLSTLIEDFWYSKKGKKTEAAFDLLMSEKGLLGIKKKYGETAAREQLELAIASEWQSILLKNHENFSVSKKPTWNPEPTTGHPAQRVFTASRGFD
tara:strand:- start:590 stop:1237 length:648 start_codon:yes stop_codon:yes gene_type:complete